MHATIEAELPTLEPPPTRVTEADVTQLLDQRYTDIRRGSTADRYVRAAQVLSTQQAWAGQRICDYIAIDKYLSSPQALHGHEIKVSRSDWLSELRKPDKAEAWRRWCNYWWLVVPDASIVKPGELPDGWGLMVPGKDGKLRARKKPPFTKAPPLPLDVVAGIAYAAQKYPGARQ